MMSSEYSVLSKATLCSNNMFNRKCRGEVQRLKIEDFDGGIQIGATSDPTLLDGLSDAEK